MMDQRGSADTTDMSGQGIFGQYRTWFLIGLLNLLAAGIIGTLLRAMYITELSFVRFRPWLHGHSHTALLGWLFLGIVIALLHDGGNGPLTKRIRNLLIAAQIAVLVMLFSFPVQGYGAVSISASFIHMMIAYVLCAILWKSSRGWPKRGSRALTRWAIGFFVLSTLGVWAIAPINALGMRGDEIYYWSVQWFLHMQFNGWFWFAAMALGVRWAERQNIPIEMDRSTLYLWVLSAILTYALAIAWSEPHPAVFALVSIGVVVQLWAAWRTLKLIRPLRSQAHGKFSKMGRWLVGIALISMALKVLVQGAVAIPAVATMAFTIRHYVMGFIHMNTLGTMTMFVLAYALLHKWFEARGVLVKWGVLLMIIGIISSELLLFLQGTFFWAGWGLITGHYWHIFLASALIPLGVLMVIAGEMIPRRA
nr:cytochrome c [uncultured bacterium]